MSNLNDLLLPVVDASDEVWASFFSEQELTTVKSLVSDLHQPRLNMGAIYPLDLEQRHITALRIVADSEDVSCLSFY